MSNFIVWLWILGGLRELFIGISIVSGLITVPAIIVRIVLEFPDSYVTEEESTHRLKFINKILKIIIPIFIISILANVAIPEKEYIITWIVFREVDMYNLINDESNLSPHQILDLFNLALQKAGEFLK